MVGSSSIRRTSYPMRDEERFLSFLSFEDCPDWTEDAAPAREALAAVDAAPPFNMACGALPAAADAACWLFMESMPVPPTCEVSADPPAVEVAREGIPETDERANAVPVPAPIPSMPPTAAMDVARPSLPDPGEEFNHSAVDRWRLRASSAWGSRGR